MKEKSSIQFIFGIILLGISISLTLGKPPALGETQWQFRLQARQNAVKLEEKKWVVESLNGKEIEIKGGKPFISFDSAKSSAGGDSGCNVFGGSYTTSKNTIRITDVISTMRACVEDDRMEIEREFMDAIQKTSRFEITGEKLYLHQKDKLVAVLRGEVK